MKVYSLPLIMIKCLLLTIILETLFALILGVKNKKDILNIVLANIITNPSIVSIVFAINIFFGVYARNIIAIILEIIVVVVEGTIYFKYLEYKKIKPYILAIILNMISYFGVELLYYICEI